MSYKYSSREYCSPVCMRCVKSNGVRGSVDTVGGDTGRCECHTSIGHRHKYSVERKNNAGRQTTSILSPAPCSARGTATDAPADRQNVDGQRRSSFAKPFPNDIVWIPTSQLLPRFHGTDTGGSNEEEEYCPVTKWPKPQDIPLPSMIPLPSSVLRSLPPEKSQPPSQWSSIPVNEQTIKKKRGCDGQGYEVAERPVAPSVRVEGHVCPCEKRMLHTYPSNRETAETHEEAEQQKCDVKESEEEPANINNNNNTPGQYINECCDSDETQKYDSVQMWCQSLRQPTRRCEQPPPRSRKSSASPTAERFAACGTSQHRCTATHPDGSCERRRDSELRGGSGARENSLHPPRKSVDSKVSRGTNNIHARKSETRKLREAVNVRTTSSNSDTASVRSEPEEVSRDREERFRVHLTNMDELYRHLLSRYDEFQKDHADFLEKNGSSRRVVDEQTAHPQKLSIKKDTVDLVDDIPPLPERGYSGKLYPLSEDSQKLQEQLISLETRWKQTGRPKKGGAEERMWGLAETAVNAERDRKQTRPLARRTKTLSADRKISSGRTYVVKKAESKESRGRTQSVKRAPTDSKIVGTTRHMSPRGGARRRDVSPQLVYNFLAAQKDKNSEENDGNGECVSDSRGRHLDFTREQVLHLVRERKMLFSREEKK
ncbi:hypothetical protein, conserved [Trypanosoma brucei gambiense DAL972]|uniref:Uncharacterized protein n=1 Tax=Trypanosoma brucei gambiense (strain MHOM/CI/86/DAL972) TaxID=679716 RepID=D0A141_TRYB9|nr:hypothetical protein, conserved [Trypanosoma brucei gambiense DAL972]CBH14983.1 hypothetical protein, conserved [Trypanosoma brucei gambiense DAL972]|eukprot:XP_011777249.1 hypothetical protein, conserved [Trypanosoma brucei gambiense DAL972]